MSVRGVGGGGRAEFDTGGSEGLGPVGIPLHHVPHPGENFESWSTRKVKLEPGGKAELDGIFGVGVLEPAHVRIENGKAFVKGRMYAPRERALDAAETKAFEASLSREIANGGRMAKNLQGVLDRLHAKPPTTGPIHDLGTIGDLRDLKGPGSVLAGSSWTFKPGESLRFEDYENQIRGLGAIKVSPAGALEVTRKMVDPGRPSFGNAPRYEYTFTVPKNAKPGKTVTVTTAGDYQTRNSPDWAFSFKVKVGKK